MSVASEISRLRTAKADLKTSIEAKGVTVPSSAKLDNYANYVDAISTGVTPTGNIDITSAGVTDVTNYATATVPSAEYLTGIDHEYYTEGGNLKWRVRGRTELDTYEGDTEGWLSEGTHYGEYVVYNAIPMNTSVTPTESAQTIGGVDYMMNGAVTVNAIPSNYVGSGITQRTSSDLTASGATVTAPAGYYSSAATKTIPNAVLDSPTWSTSKDSTYYKTSYSAPIYTAGYLNYGLSGTYSILLEDKSVTPSEIQQVVTPTNNSYYLNNVTVNAIPSNYVGSGITRRNDTDLSGVYDDGTYSVDVPAGYFQYPAYYEVPNGTAGTPTATKGTVTNHSVTVTPSVTNTSGYIVGSTINGTAVSVSASELVSGTLAINSSGTKDVTNYASATVASGSATASATKGSVSNHSITVTPSVTKTAGYITAGTTNGTAVSVSASELVSGTYTVIDDGTFDITNYASLSVPGMSLPTSAVSSTSYELMRANFLPSESTRYIEIPKGFHDVDQYYMLDPVSSTYVGSGVTRRSSSDLTSSNLTVTAPSGYYASNATKTLTDANLLATNIKKDVSIFGVTGTYEGSGSGGGSVVAIDSKSTTPSSAGSSISFTGLSGEPTSFIVYTTSDLATGASPFKVAAVVFDGTDLHGQTITNTSNAQVTYDGSSFSKTYSNGTLTITSTGAYFQAQQYWLDYSYGGSSSDIHTANVQVGSGATSITFSNLEGEPIYISLIFKSNFSTSNGYQRAIWVADKLDGEGPFGMAMDSSAHYTSANYRNNGSGTTVTINSSSTNAGGYFHQPGYYQLTYVVPSDGSPYQKKTVTPTTSQQIITADTGYDALSQVTVNAIPSSFVQPTTTVGSTTYRASTSDQTISSGTYHSAAATIAAVTQTNLTAANIKSGTTITISNGQSNLWSVTGTYTGGGSGGSFSVATTTWNNSTNTTTSHEFTGLSGTPKFAVLRCTSQLTRSSSNTYYYIADIVWNGTAAYGNYHLRSNGSFNNVASNASTKFTVTTGTNSITFTSGGSRGGAPGAFYNGTYELTYVY